MSSLLLVMNCPQGIIDDGLHMLSAVRTLSNVGTLGTCLFCIPELGWLVHGGEYSMWGVDDNMQPLCLI